MKQIRFHEHGGPDVLRFEDVPEPKPKVGQVLVRVTAAGVNFADLIRRAGGYPEPCPLPYVLGTEAAGTIEAIGNDVKHLTIGMPVIAICTQGGGYSQYVVATSGQIVPLPSGVPPAEATSLIVQGLTAYLLLKDRTALQPGQSVLVHAAAGGVGTLAIQIAKLLGAGRVIGTASTEAKLALARSLGADDAIDYTKVDWPERVRASNGGKGVDIILEMVGGEIFARSIDILAPFGHLVSFGMASGQPPLLNASRIIATNQTVSGFYAGGYVNRGNVIPSALKAVFTYAAKGELTIPPPTVFPLNRAAEAHSELAERRTTGKVVLAPWG